MRFKQILQLFEQGLHRTQEGLVSIVKLAYGMNHDGKQRKRPIQVVIDRILRGHTPDGVVRDAMIWSDLHGDMESQADRNDLVARICVFGR